MFVSLPLLCSASFLSGIHFSCLALKDFLALHLFQLAWLWGLVGRVWSLGRSAALGFWLLGGSLIVGKR
jgi:hypothetical protein